MFEDNIFGGNNPLFDMLKNYKGNKEEQEKNYINQYINGKITKKQLDEKMRELRG